MHAFIRVRPPAGVSLSVCLLILHCSELYICMHAYMRFVLLFGGRVLARLL